MSQTKAARTLLVATILVLTALVCYVPWRYELRPNVLTRLHGQEMRLAIQQYFQRFTSIEGQSDPAVMTQYATGDYLAYLLEVRCIECPSVQVSTKLDVVDLQVLDYSSTSSKVYARIEYGWNEVSPKTGKVIGPCHAQAFSGIY